MRYFTIYNNQTVDEKDIPVLKYQEFLENNISILKGHAERHCVSYFGVKEIDHIKLYCCIADDSTHEIYINASIINTDKQLPTLSCQNHNFEKFDRDRILRPSMA